MRQQEWVYIQNLGRSLQTGYKRKMAAKKTKVEEEIAQAVT
jgi:hypothetical protein